MIIHLEIVISIISLSVFGFQFKLPAAVAVIVY